MEPEDICDCNEVFVLNKRERVADEHTGELIQRDSLTHLSDVADNALLHRIGQLNLVFSETSHQTLVC